MLHWNRSLKLKTGNYFRVEYYFVFSFLVFCHSKKHSVILVYCTVVFFGCTFEKSMWMLKIYSNLIHIKLMFPFYTPWCSQFMHQGTRCDQRWVEHGIRRRDVIGWFLHGTLLNFMYAPASLTLTFLYQFNPVDIALTPRVPTSGARPNVADNALLNIPSYSVSSSNWFISATVWLWRSSAF